jgi:hypothetical protein
MTDWALEGEDPALVKPIAPDRNVPFLASSP